jgi:hypothetical protein
MLKRNIFASANIIRVIKSRRTRWTGHVAGMGEMRNAKFRLENMKGRDHLEELCADGKIMLKRILGKYGEKLWTSLL